MRSISFKKHAEVIHEESNEQDSRSPSRRELPGSPASPDLSRPRNKPWKAEKSTSDDEVDKIAGLSVGVLGRGGSPEKPPGPGFPYTEPRKNEINSEGFSDSSSMMSESLSQLS